MADGFLNRWSRRKSGLESEADPSELRSKAVAPATQNKQTPSDQAKVADPEPPSPTLEDVEKIDRFAPDFSAFMKPNVDPAVQQAAMKKLFSDPHFNIMDRLDIYIDDYSVSDPIPMEMLKRMVQSESLGLFRKRDEEDSLESTAESTKSTTVESELTHSNIEVNAAREDGVDLLDQGDVTLPEQPLTSLDDAPKKKIE